MSGDLYVSASAAVSRLRQLDSVANNIANVDSIGFKADRAIFESALSSSLQSAHQRRIAGAPGRVFVATDEMRSDHRAGPIERTGAPLDVAIEGPGYFVVETPAGERFTRAGSFAIGADGLLSTPGGRPVVGTGGTIEVGSRPVRIQGNGQVVNDAGSVLGRLRIVQFEETSALEKEGGGLFRAKDAAAARDAPRTSLLEGSLEQSNVEAIHEMAVMMILQRSYQASMRALQADDTATGRLIQEVSR